MPMRGRNDVVGNMTNEDVESLVNYAVTMQRLEGLSTPVEETDMLCRYLRGEITEDDYMRWVWRRAGVDV